MTEKRYRKLYKKCVICAGIGELPQKPVAGNPPTTQCPCCDKGYIPVFEEVKPNESVMELPGYWVSGEEA